jgi:hypothetical protein
MQQTLHVGLRSDHGGRGAHPVAMSLLSIFRQGRPVTGKSLPHCSATLRFASRWADVT